MKSDNGEIMRFDVRVTKKQGELIKQRANDAGMSANQFLINKTLGNPSEPSDWKGKIASDMCWFRILEQRITDEALRKEFTELGDAIWQSLK